MPASKEDSASTVTFPVFDHTDIRRKPWLHRLRKPLLKAHKGLGQLMFYGNMINGKNLIVVESAAHARYYSAYRVKFSWDSPGTLLAWTPLGPSRISPRPTQAENVMSGLPELLRIRLRDRNW